MVISFKLKTLFNALMLGGAICTFSLTTMAASSDEQSAPKATPEEAKIRHWNVQEIDRNFWDIPELENAFKDASPNDRKDGVLVGKLGTDGGNKAAIMALAKEIVDKQHAEVDSLLIAHQGKLLFESYYSRGRVDLSHPQSSTTKSYTSLALGRAIQLGYLTMEDLHKPVVGFLNGLDASQFAPGVETLTLHRMLSMSSGLQISEEKLEGYRENRDQFSGSKQIQAYLEDTASVTPQGKVFNYQGANPDIVMHVLDTIVPGSAEEFIQNELFAKMGIENYDWRKDPSGLPAAGASSSLTSRDMLKLGQLVMNEGKWNGQQLIPKAYLEHAVDRQVPLSEEQVKNFYSGERLSNSGYGYFWWSTDLAVGDKRYSAKSAQGGGGVTILFVQELDLLVVVTAHARQAYLQMIAEKVLPAFLP